MLYAPVKNSKLQHRGFPEWSEQQRAAGEHQNVKVLKLPGRAGSLVSACQTRTTWLSSKKRI